MDVDVRGDRLVRLAATGLRRPRWPLPSDLISGCVSSFLDAKSLLVLREISRSTLNDVSAACVVHHNLSRRFAHIVTSPSLTAAGVEELQRRRLSTSSVQRGVE